MRSLSLAAAAAVCVFFAIAAHVPQHARANEPAAVASAPSGPSFCAAGLEPLDDDACFAPPEEERLPVPLLVYLHGRYADPTEELDRQSRLARLASERGFAVLALRGVRGECTSPEFRGYFCFPSNERNAGDGPAFVARYDAAIARARERLGAGPNVLLGFSNGGYFAALIATHGLARFAAVAVAHGGPVGAVTAPRDAAVPMLLVTSDDAARPEMEKLDQTLTQAGWPHALVAREGGHSLSDWDMNTAVTFFERVLREGFPLVPPLASRAAQ